MQIQETRWSQTPAGALKTREIQPLSKREYPLLKIGKRSKKSCQPYIIGS
jgi:hypothetical protein